ncbi:hypothetical protein GCM10009809_39860 [Isoptericola hypogeus]|uniref:Uncharacterized protein n=1 Tax=Isoptericola hypogeus TaxID=300179 RepID=A0ABP4VZJ7_9MICO
MPVKTPKGATLTADQKCYNLLQAALRAVAERGNALLKRDRAPLADLTPTSTRSPAGSTSHS